MSLLSDVITWFNDPAHWRGDRGVPNRVFEHVQISVVAIVASLIIALPIAVWLGHKQRFGTVAVNVSNVGRAIPSFAILVLATQQFGLLEYPIIGSFTTFLALVALAVPPLVTNGYTAVAQVPDDVRDAAKGMGLSGGQVLRRVELPMAVPLLMAGVRTASVQVVATATIAAFVGVGGLGRYIIDGRSLPTPAEQNATIFAGALLVALLSLATELSLSALQRWFTPKGLHSDVLSARAAALVATPIPEGKASL